MYRRLYRFAFLVLALFLIYTLGITMYNTGVFNSIGATTTKEQPSYNTPKNETTTVNKPPTATKKDETAVSNNSTPSTNKQDETAVSPTNKTDSREVKNDKYIIGKTTERIFGEYYKNIEFVNGVETVKIVATYPPVLYDMLLEHPSSLMLETLKEITETHYKTIIFEFNGKSEDPIRYMKYEFVKHELDKLPLDMIMEPTFIEYYVFTKKIDYKPGVEKQELKGD